MSEKWEEQRRGRGGCPEVCMLCSAGHGFYARLAQGGAGAQGSKDRAAPCPVSGLGGWAGGRSRVGLGP